MNQKKNVLKNVVLSSMEKASRKSAGLNGNLFEWPPKCQGIFSQPQRPAQKQQEKK